MSSTYAYRIEVSGPWSGSAYRYHSLLTGSLEVLRSAIPELIDEGGPSTLITEGFAAVVELLVNEACVFRCSLLPALTLTTSRSTFTFGNDGWQRDGVVLDDEWIVETAEEIVEAFIEPWEMHLDLDALALPKPSGVPVGDGTVVTVTTLEGYECRQVVGELVRDLPELHKCG